MSAIIHLPYTHHCFVCGANNPHGLQLRFRHEHGEIRSDLTPRAHHAGYKGIVHGGVIAAALDEVMFWAAAYTGRRFYVSVEMTTRWNRKVEVGQAYRLVGHLLREQRRFCFTTGELRDATGAVCASATGKYYPMRDEDVAQGVVDFYDDPATLSPAELLTAP